MGLVAKARPRNGAQRREQPGPWRWWEVAVTAYTPAKKGRIAPAIPTSGRALGIQLSLAVLNFSIANIYWISNAKYSRLTHRSS